MIKIPNDEKKLLRKFLKQLDIKFYDLTDKEQQTWYESVWFQMLLDGLNAVKNTKKEAKKERKEIKKKTLNSIEKQIRKKIFLQKHWNKVILWCVIILFVCAYFLFI